MNVLASANEFLPTNNEPLFTIWEVALLFVGTVVIFAIVCLILKKPPAVAYVAPASIALMVLSIVAPTLNITTHINNSKNLKANIEKVYDFDEVDVWQYAASVLNTDESVPVTVKKNGKTTAMVVTQNNETFEPTLSKAPEPPTDDELDEWLEKK